MFLFCTFAKKLSLSIALRLCISPFNDLPKAYHAIALGMTVSENKATYIYLADN
jgi:hypothetical protein